MSRPSFLDIPDLWEWDGSLRDVYVFNMTSASWNEFLQFATSYPFQLLYEQEAREQWPPLERLFARDSGSHLLKIYVDTLQANCHFFSQCELELDLDPREIAGPGEHESILQFLESLSQALRKPVRITPENGRDFPIMEYEPLEGKWHLKSATAEVVPGA